MSAHQKPITLDNCYYQIGPVVELRKALIKQMEPFLTCKIIQKSVFANDDNLTVHSSEGSDVLEFSYAGTTIIFVVIVGLLNGLPEGKILCMHKYQLSSDKKRKFLGEFLLTEHGRTNFADYAGQTQFTHNSADLILAYFFTKALENNLSIDFEA